MHRKSEEAFNSNSICATDVARSSTLTPDNCLHEPARSLKVLCILGHPRNDSLCAALRDSFVEGARAVGADVQTIAVADLSFDPDVHVTSPEDQRHESDLRHVQSLVDWADHLVFVYPTWWGGAPARLKGLLDRCLTPGFAFQHRDDGSWDKLLRGKTAQLLTTMDTPLWVYRLIYGSPGFHMLERATLGYCGIRSVRRTVFSPVVHSSAQQRDQWLQKARQAGCSLMDGPLTSRQRQRDRVLAWLRALRLQFYPMSFVAYLVGALAASGGHALLDSTSFWVGYVALFLLEAATVFSNERFDQASDRLNSNAGPFNGGSRVLVNGDLDAQMLDCATLLAVSGYIFIAGWLVLSSLATVSGVLWFCVLCIAAMGYTVPPLSLSHHGMGELDVAFTHSIGVMMAGFLLQGGAITDPLPWLLSLPLGLAVMPAIILSGLPDHEADRRAGKRTLAVILGKPLAAGVAIACALLAVLAAGLAVMMPLSRDSIPTAILPIAFAHALVLVFALLKRLRSQQLDGRIDRLMVLALSYCIWFGLLPLWTLW